MTDGQVKYQTVMENRRHNLEMEQLGAQEAATKREEAAIKRENLALAAEANRIADYNAKTARKKQNVDAALGVTNMVLSSYGEMLNSTFVNPAKAASNLFFGAAKSLFA